MGKNDPYRDRKIYHKAHMWGPNGQVSALCFPNPRPINLNRASWTITDKTVTCPKCLKIMEREIAQGATA